MANQPNNIPMAWATSNSTVGTIPTTTEEQGKASWAQGFPLETGKPLTQGGIPPKYSDFNAILQILSEFALFAQEGGQYAYSATIDYNVGALVLGADGYIYRCALANGPSSTVVSPVGDSSGKWEKLISQSEITAMQTQVTSATSASLIAQSAATAAQTAATGAQNAVSSLNAAAVKITGNQSIGGTKTFSGNAVFSSGATFASGLTASGGVTITTSGGSTIIPSNVASNSSRFLRGDGTWADIGAVASATSAASAGVATKIGTATVGSNGKPVYISAGIPVSMAVVTSATNATSATSATSAATATSAVSAGVASKIGTATVGASGLPVYMSAGIPVSMAVVTSAANATNAATATNATNATSATNATNAASAGVATKIGTGTVGTSTKPVYISAGVPVSMAVVASATNATSATSAGTATSATSATSAASAGIATKLGTATVGTSTKPIYLSAGIPVSMAVVTSATNATNAANATSLGGQAAAAYALNGTVVKLSGNQEIAGTKTFNDWVWAKSFRATSYYALHRDVNDDRLVVYGGKSTAEGAFLVLFGRDNTSNGQFRFGAVSSDSTKLLDGKADGTLTWDGLDVMQRCGTVTQSATVTSSNQWFKIASTKNDGGANRLFQISLYITGDGYNTFGSGILKAQVTIASNSLVNQNLTQFHWVTATADIDVNNFVLAYDPSSTTTDIELWARIPVQYGRYNFVVLSDTKFRVNGRSDCWTIYSSEVGSNITAGLTQKTSAILVQENTYKKRIITSLDLNFPNYTAAVAACQIPSSYSSDQWIYPQGFVYDADENLYILYTRNAGEPYSAVVKYNKNFVYAGYILVSRSLESVVVKKDGNVLNLYARDNTSSPPRLLRYNITNASWSGEKPTGVDVGIPNVASNFYYDNGRWFILQQSPSLGNKQIRDTLNIYNDSFVKTGTIHIPVAVTGWIDNSNPYYNYVPKMQGFCVRGGNIYIAHGGFHRINPLETKYPVSDYGVSELSTDGTLLRYGVVNSQSFASRLSAMGYTVARTENEGVVVHPKTKELHSLLIIGTKILLLEEFAEGGIDYSDIPSQYVPFNLKDYENFFWRSTSKSGTTIYTDIYNPVTQERITSFGQILDFMVQTSLPSTMYYSSTLTLTYPSGMTIPSGRVVRIYNGNNISFCVEVIGANSTSIVTYLVYNSNGTWVAS